MAATESSSSAPRSPTFPPLSPSFTPVNPQINSPITVDFETPESSPRTYTVQEWEMQDRQPPDGWVRQDKEVPSIEDQADDEGFELVSEQHHRLQAALETHDNGRNDDVTVVGESTAPSAPPALASPLALGSPLPQRSPRGSRVRRARKVARREETSPPQRLARRSSGINYTTLRPLEHRLKDPIRAVYNPRLHHEVRKILKEKKTRSGVMVQVDWKPSWVPKKDVRMTVY